MAQNQTIKPIYVDALLTIINDISAGFLSNIVMLS